MMFRNKLDYFLIIGFIFLPIILHLNEINLNQYELLTINYLILFQIIISLVVFSLSLMIYLIFKKNFLSEILICNFSIFYFLFYYKKVNSFEIIQSFNNFHYILDNLITSTVFIFLYLLIFFLLKKYKNQTIAILTGFMIGSIHIIWPFKDKLAVNRNIDLSLFDITFAYNYKFPFDASIYFISTLVLMVIGFLSVSLIENRSSD